MPYSHSYTQNTSNTASTTYLNKTYYDRNLLENAKTKLIHAEYGQKRSIPKNNGKTVEFRRWTNFDPSLVTPGLSEGVTPDGQSLAQTNITATVTQYGAYVEVSDMLKTTSYDDVMTGSTDLLGEQMGVAIEWITRDKMNSGTNVQYADGQASRLAITSAKVLNTTEVRKAVRTLKKHKARPFTREGGKEHFIAIVSPDAVYDLQNDSVWQNVSQYSNAEQIYSGEIGRIFGVVFIESTEAKVFKQSVLNKVASVSGKTITLTNDLTDAEKTFLSTAGNTFKAGSVSLTVASLSDKVVTCSETVSGVSANDIVYSEDAGAIDATTKAGTDVHSCLVFGRDAYGIIDIAGGGNVHTIIKAAGSAGTADPLDQRSTVGAKVDAYTCEILNGDWILRIEHGVSA